MNEHENDDLSDYTMPNYATEVLENIFSFLKPKQLLKCRVVCSRWKVIVDSLFRNENLWRRNCQIDFADIYKTAYQKRISADVSWRSLYRSLTLWSKLQNATETRDEFASASYFTYEIRDFQVLRGGEIGVHTRRGIVYYDIKTLKQSNRGIIWGDYLNYVENDDIILILGITLHLYVIRKIIRSPRHTEEKIFPSVNGFLLNNNMVYYVTINKEIYMCNLLDEELKSILLCEMLYSIVCLGYKNGLNIITYERSINTIDGNKCVFQGMLDDAPNLLHILNQYNFLENLDWSVYFQWMSILRHNIPRGAMRDIIVVKVYGDIVFVGLDYGEFRIYHSPYFNNEFDLFRTEPVKQYNFSERSDCPERSLSPVIKIDVIEGEDTHTVLVAMPKKIAVLNFIHDGPNKHFNEAQSVQILNTDDPNDPAIHSSSHCKLTAQCSHCILTAQCSCDWLGGFHRIS